jgi:hypothetical protein
MEANILDGVYLRIGGEAGRTNGLSWHIFAAMFDHLQNLITLLAKYEMDTDLSPDLKSFEIELFDFKPGSAVPAFRVVPSVQRTLMSAENEQMNAVAERFDELMSYANNGAYEQFFSKDILEEVRYDIAEELYGFIQSAGNSPLSIVRPVTDNGKLTYSQVYKVPKFSKMQSEYLLKPSRRRKTAEEPEQIFALIQRVGKRRTIVDLYENKDTVLSIAPSQIVLDDRIYHLHNPLNCTVQKEDGNFIIENQMLDLVAAGSTLDEAEHDLYKEFHESYQLLSSISDSELSDRLLRAKIMFNAYIKEITLD